MIQMTKLKASFAGLADEWVAMADYFDSHQTYKDKRIAEAIRDGVRRQSSRGYGKPSTWTGWTEDFSIHLRFNGGTVHKINAYIAQKEAR